MVQDTILVSHLVWAASVICKTDKNIPTAPRGSCTHAILMHNCISKKIQPKFYDIVMMCIYSSAKVEIETQPTHLVTKKDKTVVNSNGQPLLFL